eukprot:468538_1
MGFDENLSLEASKQYPMNLNDAINYIIKHQHDSSHNENEPEQNYDDQLNILDNDGDNDENKHDDDQPDNYVADDHDDLKDNNKQQNEEECNGDIKLCPSLNRIIQLLKIYQNNNENHEKDLIGDYHHILVQHLSAENNTNTNNDTDDNFELIYDMLVNNGIVCDLTKCKMYVRNNRNREVYESKISINEDLMDTIHCYFLHSFDIGFRIK